MGVGSEHSWDHCVLSSAALIDSPFAQIKGCRVCTVAAFNDSAAVVCSAHCYFLFLSLVETFCVFMR